MVASLCYIVVSLYVMYCSGLNFVLVSAGKTRRVHGSTTGAITTV